MVNSGDRKRGSFEEFLRSYPAQGTKTDLKSPCAGLIDEGARRVSD
jgi:hypothetical protein